MLGEGWGAFGKFKKQLEESVGQPGKFGQTGSGIGYGRAGLRCSHPLPSLVRPLAYMLFLKQIYSVVFLNSVTRVTFGLCVYSTQML